MTGLHDTHPIFGGVTTEGRVQAATCTANDRSRECLKVEEADV